MTTTPDAEPIEPVHSSHATRPEATRARRAAAPGKRAPGRSAALCGLLRAAGLAAALLVPLGVAPAASASAAGGAAAAPGTDYRRTTCFGIDGTARELGATLLGEPITVTRSVVFQCTGVPVPLHVVFVVDTSERMSRDALDDVTAVLRDSVPVILRARDDSAALGLVTYGRTARTVCGLTNDAGRALACLAAPRAGEGTATAADGLDEAWRLLAQGRQRWLEVGIPSDGIREVVVLVSDGDPEGMCKRSERSARVLEANGVLIIAACVSRRCRERCLRPLAWSRRYFAAGPSALRHLLQTALTPVRPNHAGIVLTQVTLTETLSAGVSYLGSDDFPPPEVFGGAETRLVWRWSRRSHAGVTATYRVAPRAPGHQPLSDGAELSFTDSRRLVGTMSLAAPWVLVLDGLMDASLDGFVGAPSVMPAVGDQAP